MRILNFATFFVFECNLLLLKTNSNKIILFFYFSNKVEGIYVPVSQVNDSTVLCHIDSGVIFFIYRYLSYGSVIHPALHIVTNNHENGDLIKVDISGFKYSLLRAEDLNEDIHKCYLPIYYSVEENYCIAGFCAVLRQVC